MIDLATLVERPGPWLLSERDPHGIVVSSRVRLARNLAERPFRRKLTRADEEALVGDLMDDAQAAVGWSDALDCRLADLETIERKILLERRLASREMVLGRHPGGVLVAADERAAVMVNEEDHVRIQAMRPGLGLDDCLQLAIDIDRRLEDRVTWAVHPRYGYLTSCPTNTGTGLRASVMLHLPGLAESKELPVALRGMAKLHLAVRGLLGEGSEASGHYYQVSNQRTLGRDEHEIVDHLHSVVRSLIEYEQLARATLQEKRPSHLADKVHRAWGLLTHARRLTGKELVEQLSWVRLGRALGLLDVAWSALDRLFVHGQAAHLEFRHPEALDPGRRDEIRASLVRAALQPA